jgi:hypothetical protein
MSKSDLSLGIVAITILFFDIFATTILFVFDNISLGMVGLVAGGFLIYLIIICLRDYYKEKETKKW